MDNYRCYLTARVWILSPPNRTLFPILGASVSPGDGDLDGCTSCDSGSNVTFFSIPAWSVDLTLAEWAYLLQLLQVPYLPPNFSLEIDSFDFRMIDISSQSGTSSVAHKWYTY